MPCWAYPAIGTLEEGHRVARSLAGEHLAVGNARVVIDGDVDVVPTRAWAALNAVLADALAHVPEAPQLLDIDVQQLARPLPFVAQDRGLGVPSEDVSTPSDGAPCPPLRLRAQRSRPHAGVPRCCGGARPGSRPRPLGSAAAAGDAGSGAARATLASPQPDIVPTSGSRSRGWRRTSGPLVPRSCRSPSAVPLGTEIRTKSASSSVAR